MKSSMRNTQREWKMSTCVGSTQPLIFSDIYSHSWAQGWPAPPVLDAEDKCQPHPLEASCAYMHIGNQIRLAYHTLRLECPSFRRALIALCHPTSHHHLIGSENGGIVCCIFNGSKTPTKLNSFHIICLDCCALSPHLLSNFPRASALPIVTTLSRCMPCKGCSTPATLCCTF